IKIGLMRGVATSAVPSVAKLNLCATTEPVEPRCHIAPPDRAARYLPLTSGDCRSGSDCQPIGLDRVPLTGHESVEFTAEARWNDLNNRDQGCSPRSRRALISASSFGQSAR